MKFNDFLNDQLKNKELKKEYDKLTPEYEIISAIIKARNEKGLTQSELAKTIGTDQARISKLEKGTLNPSLDFLKRIADGLGQELHISFIPKQS
ncbi:helix-turn-helix transcriptional regulator [uncultured Cetobacterium sp.]|uniref:helix-turn-helix domain-containing protein n=1 Tax=uncultured Cetobacterium sp. TaxID=527638 RepID=UPI0025ECB6DC|nr:helix-turn-helix transcriptional regulator [uncultured Cetobacterium sp.]